MQLAQAFEYAVVEVFAVNECGHHRPQREQFGVGQGSYWRHDTALQPGEALPFAAMGLQVGVEHRHADRDGAGIAMGPQGQVHAKYEAVFRGLANKRLQRVGDRAEVLLRADGAGSIGLPVLFVNIDEVDI